MLKCEMLDIKIMQPFLFMKDILQRYQVTVKFHYSTSVIHNNENLSLQKHEKYKIIFHLHFLLCHIHSNSQGYSSNTTASRSSEYHVSSSNIITQGMHEKTVQNEATKLKERTWTIKSVKETTKVIPRVALTYCLLFKQCPMTLDSEL